MARFVDDRSNIGVFGQLSLAVVDFVERLRTSFAWTAAFRTTLEELQRLSDRELSDLGMMRADLPQIARQAADEAVADR